MAINWDALSLCPPCRSGCICIRKARPIKMEKEENRPHRNQIRNNMHTTQLAPIAARRSFMTTFTRMTQYASIAVLCVAALSLLGSTTGMIEMEDLLPTASCREGAALITSIALITLSSTLLSFFGLLLRKIPLWKIRLWWQSRELSGKNVEGNKVFGWKRVPIPYANNKWVCGQTS